MLIDTHCHIQFQGYKDDREAVLLRCKEKNLIMNAVGSQKQTSKLAVEMTQQHENIYATIGLHPVHLFPTHIDEEESSFKSREEDFDEEFYGQLVKSEKVIAIGECGLELFHLPKNKTKEEILEKQTEIFLKQFNFAVKHDLPLVIHVRDAYGEMIKLLETLCHPERSEGSLSSRDSERDSSASPQNDRKIQGVVHCFGGNWEQAQKFLNMGLYLGFTGILTFPPKKTDPKPSKDLLEVAKNIPLDKFLIETDAPYLAPQKYRGKRCEPWMVEEVAKKIAEIRQKSVEEIENLSIKNAKNLFTKIN
jgi:TatD DNase family protein